MRAKTRAMAAAAITSLALLATACGGGGGESPDPGTSAEGQAGGEITIAGCTPQNPLIPGNTSETCGGDIIDAMTSKLVEYNTENAAPRTTSPSRSRPRQQDLHGQAQAVQVPRRHRCQGQDFVDAWNYTPTAPTVRRQLLHGPDRRLRRHPGPGADCKQAGEGQDHVGPEGRRRIAGCTPQKPLIPGGTSETCGGNIIDAMPSPSSSTTTPKTAAPENDIAESIETERQPELHRQAQAGLQVPRRHRGQGQELRRRLELRGRTAPTAS